MVDDELKKTRVDGCLGDASPELAAQLVDQDLAYLLKPFSMRKVWWRCGQGHEWEARVQSRSKGSGCPYCSGRKPVPGVNDLATTDPELAVQLVDSSLATELSRASNKVVEWQCEKGHVWKARVEARAVDGHGCPYCSGRRAVAGENDLATLYPDLAKELVDSQLASELTAKSNKVVRWRCKHGHEWESSVNNRVKLGRGCPYCVGQRRIAGMNDLATTHSHVADMLVDKSLATKFGAGSGRVVEWVCEQGHRTRSAISARVKAIERGATGCPVCANRMVVVGVNDMATTHPELAAELADCSVAKTVVAGSTKMLRWRCDKGHEWEAPSYSRLAGNGCPLCSDAMVSKEELDCLDSVRALLGSDVEVLSRNRKILAPLELDIVVPSKHIAIEFNGVYWHSEACGKGRNFHRDKMLAAESVGLQLLTVWEDDWRNRRYAVESMFAAKLGVAGAKRLHARSLAFGQLSGRDAAVFLNESHMQGTVTATRHFALFDGNTVVAVLSLRSPRQNARMKRTEGEWEIQRYATSVHVPGGFSKLLTYAGKALRDEGFQVNSWVSFSSNEVSDGTMYETCGFELVDEIGPDYKYVGNATGWIRKSKEAFQRRRFREDPNLIWDESWTEAQAAEANGLYRCWDCGKKKWRMECK